MDRAQTGPSDVYGRTHEMDERTLEVMATRLEARGSHPFFLNAIDEYMDALALSGGERLLELGCGTGAATRVIARRPEVTAPIVAIDLSPHLIATALRLAEDEGLGARIDLRVGDAHALPLDERGFDVVILHTLISHVTDPGTVLDEAVARLKPGSGRLVVFDGDYASLTFATEAEDGGAATDHAVHDALIAQPRVMRAMPRLLNARGMPLRWSRAYVVADIGKADYFGPMIVSLRVLLPKAGAMTEAEAASFADSLEAASAANHFFGASNFDTFIAQRAG